MGKGAKKEEKIDDKNKTRIKLQLLCERNKSKSEQRRKYVQKQSIKLHL